MDIGRRGTGTGDDRKGKPAPSVSDIQKRPATPPRIEAPPQQEPVLPLAPKVTARPLVKQADEILPPVAAVPESGTLSSSPLEDTVATADDPASSAAVKTIEIKIVLPALFSLSKAAELSKQPIKPVYHHVKKQVAKTSKKTRVTTGALAFVAVALVVGYTQFFSPSSEVTADTKAANRPVGLQPGAPDYPTLLPASKSIEELGGWHRVSPPDKNPVYVYADSIGGTSISVSQQPLPEEFKTDTAEKVRLLAADFNANEKVTVGSTIVFIGKSAEGPESVIFHKDNLLILIKSRGGINNAQWANYIKELR